jgi:enoyl-CoA hydratase
MSDTVLYEVRGETVILTLNRPSQRNSVNRELAAALRAALARLEADDSARVAVLTGAGEVFSAGMDLKAFLDGDGDAILFGEGRFGGFVDASRSKPIIAAVNGPALAGGCELALACDLIVANETAYFGLPEPAVGIFACAGGPFRLARRIPAAKACELALTADRLPAAEAHALGLVNRLVPSGQVLDAALDLSARILRNAPHAIAATLALLRAAGADAERDLWTRNDHLWSEITATEDAREGARAFTEKRAPRWTGG